MRWGTDVGHKTMGQEFENASLQTGFCSPKLAATPLTNSRKFTSTIHPAPEVYMFALQSIRGGRRESRVCSLLLLAALIPTGSMKLFAAGSAATSTTLSTSTTPIPSGQLATLTATVTAGGAPVTTGFVLFREGGTTLGQASLQANGIASLSALFPPGQFSVTAQFEGSSAGQPSTSQAATLTQLGTSAITLASGGKSKGKYVLTATVTGNQPQHPTGNVRFIDQMTGQELGTVGLQPGTAQYGLQPGLVPPVIGSYSASGIRLVGDFNGDGIHDYASVTSDSSGVDQLNPFFGNPDGTYQAMPPQPVSVRFLFTADFNNDGKSDLVGCGSSTCNVYLSNGDGSFTQENSVYGYAVAAGDFNGDGKMDLVTNMGHSVTALVVYLGDGTGNFNVSEPVFLANPIGPIADYNNDGNQDLIAWPEDPSRGQTILPDMYPGDDSGNFNNVTGIPIDSITQQVYTNGVGADFNRDGNADFALYLGGGNLAIFLGDGTGHFAAPWVSAGTITATGDLNTYTTLDVNGDGNPDIVAVLAAPNGEPIIPLQVLVLLGKGDGSFTMSSGVNSAPATFPLLGAGIASYPVPQLNGIASLPATATSTATISVRFHGHQAHPVIALYDGTASLPAVQSNSVSVH
jgi:hypothetical protein